MSFRDVWLGMLTWQPITLFFMGLATRVDKPLMKWSKGRIRLSFVIPVLLLHCTGARTGIERTLPLLYVPDTDQFGGDVRAGADILLVASHGGQAHHPAWYFNLMAHRNIHCTLKGFTAAYEAKLLQGEQRAAAWQKAQRVYPGYDRYQARCDQREIPVFRLTRVN